MGYFNIIESLSDTRNNKEVVNEATSILRDYKSTLSQLEKALLSCKDTTLHGDWTFLLYLCVGSMTHVRVLPVFDVNKLHQKEDTKKGRWFIYLDINDVFKADNVVYYYIEDTSNKYSAKDVADFMINGLADTLKREELFIMDDERYTEKFKNDFRDILGVDVETIDDAIKVINDFVQEVFYLGGVQDETYMVKLLQHCGINGVTLSNLYDYINDTSTYNLVLEVVLDEIRTFLTDVIYENLNTDNLYKSNGEDTKGVFFINKRYLGVVAVYLNKMVNEVVLPNSCQLEKCDIFKGRNCHSDTISNYIKKGWKLPKTIDIDKQFKFSGRSGYFITMNNW